MSETVRKSYKYKLRPTPEQERALEFVLWRCRTLYNTALEQRIPAWERRHVSVSRYQQEAELKELRAELPEYAAIHSHVLQDVLARLDKTYQTFFRRLKAGKAGDKPGFPRYQRRHRWHSFTYKDYCNRAPRGTRRRTSCATRNRNMSVGTAPTFTTRPHWRWSVSPTCSTWRPYSPRTSGDAPRPPRTGMAAISVTGPAARRA